MPELRMGTESLNDVLGKFTQQAQSIVGARGDVTSTIGEVDGLLTQAQAAEPRINAILEALGQDTALTKNVTDASDWTGDSSVRFREATDSLIGIIDENRQTLAEAFAEFRAAAENLRQRLAEIGIRFDTGAGQAEDATNDFNGKLLGHVGDTETIFASGLNV